MSHLPISFKRGPRARACDTCRRWKKRCDQLKPACSRCIESNSDCTYSYVEVYYRYESETALRRNEASRMPFYSNSHPNLSYRRHQSSSNVLSRSTQTLPSIGSLLNPPRLNIELQENFATSGNLPQRPFIPPYSATTPPCDFTNQPHNYYYSNRILESSNSLTRPSSKSSTILLPPPRGYVGNTLNQRDFYPTVRHSIHSDSYPRLSRSFSNLHVENSIPGEDTKKNSID